jgi:hypothetical protein
VKICTVDVQGVTKLGLEFYTRELSLLYSRLTRDQGKQMRPHIGAQNQRLQACPIPKPSAVGFALERSRTCIVIVIKQAEEDQKDGGVPKRNSESISRYTIRHVGDSNVDGYINNERRTE